MRRHTADSVVVVVEGVWMQVAEWHANARDPR